MALLSRRIRLGSREGRPTIRESSHRRVLSRGPREGARYGLTAGHKIHRRYQVGISPARKGRGRHGPFPAAGPSQDGIKAGSLAAKCLAQFKSTQAKFFSRTIFRWWNAYER